MPGPPIQAGRAVPTALAASKSVQVLAAILMPGSCLNVYCMSVVGPYIEQGLVRNLRFPLLVVDSVNKATVNDAAVPDHTADHYKMPLLWLVRETVTGGRLLGSSPYRGWVCLFIGHGNVDPMIGHGQCAETPGLATRAWRSVLWSFSSYLGGKNSIMTLRTTTTSTRHRAGANKTQEL
ncbi:hypothetical protein FN846DRAFT_888567 [Sphaerosporella brunnea]|uniref:Uncharacterized protein n=1 Tax=Sphaerosporella brunnea TaxID=1250544 RepID=A0A5J5F2I8_9PEZI|nr:hypothetical protein FN846DRAFT_888567 [Sphaerosporella brunnea]